MKEILEKIRQFRDARNWAQFHDSKNLALAISIEAAELNELFLWKKGEEVEDINKDKLREELADILIFSLLLLDKHGLDFDEIILDKISRNNEKYPVNKAKGRSDKYTDL